MGLEGQGSGGARRRAALPAAAAGVGQHHRAFPYTPSVSNIHGIEAACDQVLEEGPDAAIARHAAAACRAGVREMGLRLWPRGEEITAACVTATAVPDGLDHLAVRDHARERYGVMLSGAHGAGNLVRIGHMGQRPTVSIPSSA